MKNSAWLPATIDIDRSPTEFTGDDVDRFSDLVDLGAAYEKLVVIIPELTSGVVSVYGQGDKEIDTIPFQIQKFDGDATGHFAHATTAGTGEIIITFDIGCLQFVRMHVAANQAADRVFKIAGVRS